MQEKNSPVKEALIQMKQVEEAIAENAKGILASTMKEEINQLVKESLFEQKMDDEEGLDDTDVDSEDVDINVDAFDDTDVDNDDEETFSTDMDMEDDSETPIDLTDASDEEILKVFKAMGEDDGIIIKKDGSDIHLTDNDADTEYLVKLGESINETDMNQFDEEDETSTDEIMRAIFSDKGASDFEPDEEEEGVVYEIQFDEEEEFDEQDDLSALDNFEVQEEEDPLALESDDEYMMEDEDPYMMEYDSEMMEDEDSEMMEDEDSEMMEDDDEFETSDYGGDLSGGLTEGSYNPKKTKKSVKGLGVKGHGPKFSYKTSKGGFKEDMKQGPKTMGTGSAKKFKYSDGENLDGKPKMVKKTETKEASRTFGFGSKEGRGLRKGITPNRNYVYGKSGVKKESLESEVSMLREKNEEYRKALNVFRDKLNEVAVFNSNLAYATRLFTEHSTTKKEKINILRRFDGVESLKESKTLYKSIREELNKGENTPINESVERKLNKNVTTGSSTTLIESKTYENPQFLRMKDLMSKIG